MKKNLLILLFWISAISVNGQRWKPISSDSLLHFLQNVDNIYDAFDNDSYFNIFFDFNDYKNAYFNDSLKNILVNLVTDTVGWCNYFADKYINNLLSDTLYRNCRVKEWLRNNHIDIIDTVFKSELLFNQYLDSTILYERNQRFNSKKERLFLPYLLVDLISEIRYSEAYNTFYKCWLKEKEVNNGDYFRSMCSYQCPELINNYFEISKSYSLENYTLKEIHSALSYSEYEFSSAVKMRINFLDKKYPYYDIWGNELPVNIIFVKKLIDDAYLYPNLKDIISRCNRCNDQTEENEIEMCYQLIIDHKDEFVKVFEKMLSKLEQQELYWKQNMPYYKKEEE